MEKLGAKLCRNVDLQNQNLKGGYYIIMQLDKNTKYFGARDMKKWLLKNYSTISSFLMHNIVWTKLFIFQELKNTKFHSQFTHHLY